jgi:hypothetical protein
MGMAPRCSRLGEAGGCVAVSIDPMQQSVQLTQGYTVPLTIEPAVVISIRDYERLIERLDSCKPGAQGLRALPEGLAIKAQDGHLPVG